MNEQNSSTGTVEGKLEGGGTFYIFISFLVFAVCFVFAFSDEAKLTNTSFIWIGVGLGLAAQGIIFWILFKGAAEVIRLLKKLNGISYEGHISGNNQQREFTCTECGAATTEKAKYCSHCGVSFEEPEGQNITSN